jgi:hypothetical protein
MNNIDKYPGGNVTMPNGKTLKMVLYDMSRGQATAGEVAWVRSNPGNVKIVYGNNPAVTPEQLVTSVRSTNVQVDRLNQSRPKAAAPPAPPPAPAPVPATRPAPGTGQKPQASYPPNHVPPGAKPANVTSPGPYHNQRVYVINGATYLLSTGKRIE